MNRKTLVRPGKKEAASGLLNKYSIHPGDKCSQRENLLGNKFLRTARGGLHKFMQDSVLRTAIGDAIL